MLPEGLGQNIIMFSAPPAVATGHPGSVGQRSHEPGEWTSGDVGVDQRLAQLGGLQADVAEQFMALDASQRLKIGKSTIAKVPPISNLNSWIAACIRKHCETLNAALTGKPPSGAVFAPMQAVPVATPARAHPYQVAAAPVAQSMTGMMMTAPMSGTSSAASMGLPQCCPPAMGAPSRAPSQWGEPATRQGIVAAAVPMPAMVPCIPCDRRPSEPAGGSEVSLTQSSKRSVDEVAMPGNIRGVVEEYCTHHKKGPFLQAVMGFLNKENRTALLRLPAEEHHPICYLMAMNPKFWKDADKFAQAFLAVRLQLRAAVQQRPEPIPEIASTAKVLRIAICHGCCGIGTSVHVLHAALEDIFQELAAENVQCQIVSEVGFDVDPVALKVAEAWMSKRNLNVAFVERSAEQWALAVQADAERMSNQDVRAALLIGTPCNNLTHAKAGNMLQGSGLHTAPSNAVWDIHGASTVLQQTMGGNFVFLSEQVKCAHEDDHKELDKLFGPATKSTSSSLIYARGHRDRHIRCSPFLPNSWPHHDARRAPCLADGWTWNGNAENCADGFLNITVRGYLGNIASSVAIQVATGEPVLSAISSYELRCYESVKMSRNGEVRLANRELLLFWMGLEDTGLLEVFDELFPCMPRIFPTMGCEAGPNEGEACGQSRWCENCEIVLKLIGQAWEGHAMRDVSYAWIRKALFHWANVDVLGPDSFFRLDPDLVHRCSDTCEHRLRGY